MQWLFGAKMAGPMSIVEDSNWREVRVINNYAVFMAYLLLGIKGLGFLVVTWTTVVLLGGFVSVLGKKDFWSLTVITLVQTTRVMDFLMNNVIKDLNDASKGLEAVVFLLVYTSSDHIKSRARKYLMRVVAIAQLLVFFLILLPIAVIFMLGLYISTGVSLWRLIQHDYVNNDGGPNLRPALDVLYTLAVAQGLLFCYRAIYAGAGRARLVREVAMHYYMDPQAKRVVSDYLNDTLLGCKKDPSFCRGKNLITYAVDLIESGTLKGVQSGATILHSFIGRSRSLVGGPTRDRQDMLLRLLLVESASSNGVLHKLMRSFDQRSPYYCDELRVPASIVVDFVADMIHLEHFPRGVQCIFCLLEDQNSSKELVQTGLSILSKLAVDEDNFTVISCIRGLIPKLVALARKAGRLQQCPHDEWSTIEVKSMEFIIRLVNLHAGDTGKVKVLQEVTSTEDGICVMAGMLQSDKCRSMCTDPTLQLMADVYLHKPSDMAVEDIIWSLLNMFLEDWPGKPTTEQAGERLVMFLSKSEGNSAVILEADGDDVIKMLTEVLVDGRHYMNRSVTAAIILENLCIHCTSNDHCIQKMKKAMTSTRVMRKVLEQVITFLSDIEDMETNVSSSSTQLPEAKLQKALISLCSTVSNKLICSSVDQTLCSELDEVVAKICLAKQKDKKTFASIMNEAKEFIDRNKIDE